MKTGYWIANIISAVVIGSGSFLVTASSGTTERAADSLRPETQQAERPDGLPPVIEYDRRFFEEAEDLRRQLRRQREELAGLLEDVGSSEEAVMAQVEKVIEMQSSLERKVARNLLKIRKHLPPGRVRHIFNLAAHGVRGQGGPHLRRDGPSKDGRPPRRPHELRPGAWPGEQRGRPRRPEHQSRDR